MAQKTLTTSYLAQLTNANHDGVSQQICDRLTAYTTDNQMLTTAVQGVVAARQAEDTAFKRYSGKDFAADDLKKEDALEDKYMSTTLAILNGLLYLPETEPIRRKAEMAKQVFKDFNFSTSAGFEAEARNVLNMAQQWGAATDYTLAELGIDEWVTKAVAQANKVIQLVAVRVDHESAKVKGELANARKATDEAIRKAYDVVNALAVLSPSAELSALISVLFGIEERAKLYYISGGSSGSKPTPSPTPDPTPTPDPQPDPEPDPQPDPEPEPVTYRLVTYKYGSGTATLTDGDGEPIALDQQVAVGTTVNISTVPAAGKVPTAKLDSTTTVALTESSGTYTGSFEMPAKNTMLEINTDPEPDPFDPGS
jgi:hypothetical protein